MGLMGALPRLQRPIFTPGPMLAGMPPRVLDVAPLYAGESVARMHDVVSAAEAVARLTAS